MNRKYNDLTPDEQSQVCTWLSALPPTKDVIHKTLQQLNVLIYGRQSFYLDVNQTRNFVNVLLDNWNKELDSPQTLTNEKK